VPHKFYLINLQLPSDSDANKYCLAANKHFLSGVDFVVSCDIRKLIKFKLN